MTTVTLETLYADCETTSRAFNDWFARDDDEWIDGLNRLADTMNFARAILVVAEKHGLNAAMLYKLSDGAIDPRGAA